MIFFPLAQLLCIWKKYFIFFSYMLASFLLLLSSFEKDLGFFWWCSWMAHTFVFSKTGLSLVLGDWDAIILKKNPLKNHSWSLQIIVFYLYHVINRTVKEKNCFWTWLLASCKFLVYNIFCVPIGVLESFLARYCESCKSPEIKEQK